MFKKKKTIEDEIQHCINALGEKNPDDPKYKDIVLNMKDLYEARSMKKAYFVELEPVLGILATFGEVLVILNFEELRVISTKAFGLLRSRF